MQIAVLALQGAFIEHEQKLSQLGISCFEIRQRRDLNQSFDGLIIPGGESTVQGKLLRELDLFTPLKAQIVEGMPVLGTCAGLILLARDLASHDDKGTPRLATMDVLVERNAYGRQLGSFYAEEIFQGIGRIPMTFIRAPYISSVSGNARILAEVDGHIVAAQDGSQLVTAFHPELNADLSVHRYFVEML